MNTPPTTISDEAVQAAAKVLGELFGARSLFEREERHADATMVLAAAVPYIEAGLRAKISDEIAARRGRCIYGGSRGEAFDLGIHVAARVARGTQEATK